MQVLEDQNVWVEKGTNLQCSASHSIKTGSEERIEKENKCIAQNGRNSLEGEERMAKVYELYQQTLQYEVKGFEMYKVKNGVVNIICAEKSLMKGMRLEEKLAEWVQVD